MTQAQKAIEEIRTQGYAILRSVYDTALLKDLLAEIHSGRMDMGEGANIPRLNSGSDIIYSPFLKDKAFFDLFRLPLVDEILRACLNDPYYKGLEGRPNYILRSMLCRSSKNALPWHIDSFFPYGGPNVISMQVIIPLERFTAANGPTLIKPGSQLSGAYSPQQFGPDDGVLELQAEVGDVIIWDARLWHAARENVSEGTRWSVISTFTRWWIKQNYQYPQVLRDTGQIAQYSDDDLIVLGGASETPYSHGSSVDLKGGMDRIAQLRSAG